MSAKHNPKVAERPSEQPCSRWVGIDEVVFLPTQGVYVCRKCRWRVVEAVMMGVATWIHTMPEPTEA